MHSNRICRALVRRRGNWGNAVLEIGAALLFVLWAVLVSVRGRVELFWNWLFIPVFGLESIALVQYTAGRFGLPISDKNRAAAMERVCASVFLGGRIVSDERTDQTIRLVSAELGICGVVVRDNPAFHVQREIVLKIAVPPAAARLAPSWTWTILRDSWSWSCRSDSRCYSFRRDVASRFPGLLLLTIVPIGAVFLSASRAGIIVLLLEFALVALFSRMHRMGKKQLLGATAVWPARRGHDVVAGSGEGPGTF